MAFNDIEINQSRGTSRQFTVRWGIFGIILAGLLFSSSNSTSAESIEGDEKDLTKICLDESDRSDPEGVSFLVVDGKILYDRDNVKLDGSYYCSQAVELAERGEFRLAIRTASKALHLGESKVSDDDAINADWRALARRDIAIAHSYAGNLRCARYFAKSALDIQAKDPRLVVGPAKKILGDVALREQKFEEAFAFYREALDQSTEKYQQLVRLSLANA